MTGWVECKEILWRNRCKFITQLVIYKKKEYFTPKLWIGMIAT